MDAEKREPVEAASPEEPTVIFDPAKLAAQLTELLELYLARAKEALAEEQMSSKEAVACAKQVSGMLEDTQSGKLAKVDTSTEWPRLGFTVVAQTQMRVGRAHQPGSFSVQQPKTDNQEPLRSLEDAVKAVCQYDEETAILEPWALLLTRINKLTQRLSTDIEAWKASCEEQEETGVGTSVPTPPNLAGEFHPPGRAASPVGSGGSGDGGTGVSGTGVPPVILSKPAQSSTGGAQVPALQKKPSVHHLPAEACSPGRASAEAGPTTGNQQPSSGYT